MSRTKMEYEMIHHIIRILHIRSGQMNDMPRSTVIHLERQSEIILDMCVDTIAKHEADHGIGKVPNWACYWYPDTPEYRAELDAYADSFKKEGKG